MERITFSGTELNVEDNTPRPPGTEGMTPEEMQKKGYRLMQILNENPNRLQKQWQKLTEEELIAEEQAKQREAIAREEQAKQQSAPAGGSDPALLKVLMEQNTALIKQMETLGKRVEAMEAKKVGKGN